MFRIGFRRFGGFINWDIGKNDSILNCNIDNEDGLRFLIIVDYIFVF